MEPRALGAAWAVAPNPQWQIRRLKDIATVINGYPFDAQLFDVAGAYPLVRIRDLYSETTETKYAGEWVEAAAIDNGDVLIGMDGDFNVGVWKGGAALLNQRMCCVRASSPLMTRFLSYVLPAPLNIVNGLTYSTTVKHLSSIDVERITLPVPPAYTLESVVNFLDEQTARIDALIGEKERLIGLLMEYRQAWLSWLLESPRGSIKTRLKFCLAASLQYGATESGDVDAVGPRYIRITDIAEDGSLSDDSVKFLTEEQASTYLLDDGDVLFARSGATVGKSFVYRSCMGRAAFAGYLIRARLDQRRLLPEYLALLTETHQYWAYLREEETQSTIQNASAEKYANFSIALPSITEQSAYLAQIRPTLDNITRLVFHTMSHVTILREYRASLISGAVTGQLDMDNYGKGGW